MYIDSIALSHRIVYVALQWRHNEHDVVSNHRRLDCLLHCLFRRRSQKTSKLRVTGLSEGNPPVTGRFPSQRASNEENVSIWWRHHVLYSYLLCKSSGVYLNVFTSPMHPSAGNDILDDNVVFGITLSNMHTLTYHDDVIKWKHFPRYWSFVREIHRSPVNSPYKGQWRGVLMFSLLICAWINGCGNHQDAVDFRRHRTHYHATVMNLLIFFGIA